MAIQVASAQTLQVTLRTGDWAVLNWREKVLGSGARLNTGVGALAPGLEFWPGKFTSVEFFQDTFGGTLLATLSANNIFQIQSCTVSVLSTGFYGGSGNGCNDEVKVARLAPNHDLYVGGTFSQAGGFPYSQKIGVFRASGGWNSTIIFSAWDIVTDMSFTSSTTLHVIGSAGLTHLHEAQIYNNNVTLTNNDGDFHLDSSGGFSTSCTWTD